MILLYFTWSLRVLHELCTQVKEGDIMAGFLNKRLSEVERNYRMMQKQLEKMHLPEVEGWLEINKKKRGFHYYHCLYDTKKKKTIRKYIPTTDLSLAKTLASTTYYKKLQHLLEERILLLHRLNLTFREDEIDRLYDDLHDARKGLFSPLQPTKQQVLAQWIQQPYFPNPMPKSSTEMKTKRGEIVRSKTEKILADMFYDAGIPYKYECPLWIRKEQPIYPDFTFLDPTTLEEIYWEHFGRMDDPDYANRTLEKIKLYETRGLHLGDRLLATFESDKVYLNYESVRQLIAKRLKWPE